MATQVAKDYLDWKQNLVLPGWTTSLPWPSDEPKKVQAMINRQVALAVLVSLERCHSIPWTEIETVYTGKSQAHWNFTLLGTTKKLDDRRAYRTEAPTSDLFVISVLNQLKAAGLTMDWAQLEEYLRHGRFRVQAVPAQHDRAREWAAANNQEGLHYPPPWDVANRNGVPDKNPTEVTAHLAGKYGWPRPISEPCKIKRVDIYHSAVQSGFAQYPQLLLGWTADQERERMEAKQAGAINGLNWDDPIPPAMGKEVATSLREALQSVKRATSTAKFNWERIQAQQRGQRVKELEDEVESLRNILDAREDTIARLEKKISQMQEDEHRAMHALGRIFEIANQQVDTGKSEDDVLRRFIETGL